MSWSIQVENLSKQYRIGNAVTPALDSIYQIVERRFAAFARRGSSIQALASTSTHVHPHEPGAHLVLTDEQREGCPDHHFWALRDVSFEIKEGDRVGIVGRNGSGKSTLLKILSRITTPTVGEFRFRGRLISLLEVGTGFHPDLTGRENIVMNAKINGMSSRGISGIFDDIVDFSELGQQIDTPIKRYSSGMYMRLAFSVAAHLESEILIVDEVLAVGDAGFQKKCLDKMLEISGRGRTLLFVSHDMNAISTLCTKAIELSHGKVVCDAAPQLSTDSTGTEAKAVDLGLRDVRKAISGYVMNGEDHCEMSWSADDAPKFRSGDVRICGVSLSNGNRVAKNIFDITENVVVQVRFEVLNACWKLNVHIYLKTMTGQSILMSMDNQTVASTTVLGKGSYSQSCVIPSNFLNEGAYRLEVVICTNPTGEFNIVLPDVLTFTMSDARLSGSVRGDWTREWPAYPIRQHLQWTKDI